MVNGLSNLHTLHWGNMTQSIWSCKQFKEIYITVGYSHPVISANVYTSRISLIRIFGKQRHLQNLFLCPNSEPWLWLGSLPLTAWTVPVVVMRPAGSTTPMGLWSFLILPTFTFSIRVPRSIPTILQPDNAIFPLIHFPASDFSFSLSSVH